jgi:LmbE family N-acetylglucosaminyl deacetylase
MITIAFAAPSLVAGRLAFSSRFLVSCSKTGGLMPQTILALGAHYDDCVFGIPGILLQAVSKHHRVVIVAMIGDYENWAPAKGRTAELKKGTIEICQRHGAEMRSLGFKSGHFQVTPETKRAVSEVVADVRPDIAFLLWPHDNHPDHEAASSLSRIALSLTDRVLESEPVRGPRRAFYYDNGPRHTIGFEPDTFVDVTPQWQPAIDWLGEFMALVRNEPYRRGTLDSAQQLKRAIAQYRGKTCGVEYCEALRALYRYPQEIF